MSASVHKLPRMQDRWPNPVFFRLVFPRILIPVTPPDIFHLDVLDSITHIYIYIYVHTYEYLSYTLDLPRTMLDSSKSVRRTHDLRPKSRGVGRITAMMVIQGDYWNFAKSASIWNSHVNHLPPSLRVYPIVRHRMHNSHNGQRKNMSTW